jgi:hypothetical protein
MSKPLTFEEVVPFAHGVFFLIKPPIIWWWFWVLFPLPDLSVIGYPWSPKESPRFYNAVNLKVLGYGLKHEINVKDINPKEIR